MEGNKELSTSEYMLQRDWLASDRLSLQHFVIKMREGWILHPTIKSNITSQHTSDTNQPDLRIADVAAGNCIWSIDMLSEHPNAEVTAFDLSPAQFPAQSCRPANLHVETWDVFDPVPEKYKNYFDVVHTRFVVGVVYKGGQAEFTRHLASMLKPGGWIQWQDVAPPSLGPIDMQTLEILPAAEWPLPVKFTVDIVPGGFEAISWFFHLDRLLRDAAGFEDTELYRPPVKREILKFEGDLVPWFYSEILRGPLAAVMKTEEGQRRKVEIEEAMQREWEMISRGERLWSYVLVVAIGRKPGGK